MLARLTPRQAGLYGAAPVRQEGDRIEVALAEPLSRTARSELEALLLADKDTGRIVFRYAPITDVSFAVRWAWSPEGLTRAIANVALLRQMALIDAAGEERLWRAIRAGHCRLGDILVRAGAIDHETLHKVLAGRGGASAPLGEDLVAQGLVSPAQLQAALTRQAEGAPRVLGAALTLGLITEADVDRLRQSAAAMAPA